VVWEQTRNREGEIREKGKKRTVSEVKKGKRRRRRFKKG
jgi:hypothetical protein